MRKFWMGLALTGLVVVSATAGAWASTGMRKQLEVEYQDIKIAVNGKTIDVGASEPFIVLEQGRTFVPARPLAEALGAKVGWNQEQSTVEVFTPDYVKSTIDGEYRVWSMPAQGFSIKAPRGFMRQDIGTALLQLGYPDLATGTSAVVAVTKTPVPNDGSTAADRFDLIMAGLKATFLPDAEVSDAVEDGNKLTLSGTATLFGQMPANFTIRVITQDSTDWMIMTLTPTSLQAKLGPVMEDVLNSFTLETK
jgi:hypothetical protein